MSRADLITIAIAMAFTSVVAYAIFNPESLISRALLTLILIFSDDIGVPR